MKAIFRHIKKLIIRGVIASIPFVLTFLVIRFLYLAIDNRIMSLFYKYTGYRIPGLGIAILLATLYLFGIIASNFVGRQIINLVERITRYIPFIKTIYQVGKQLSATLSIPEKEVLKRPVLVEYLKPGMFTIGFVTGTMIDSKSQEQFLKVFIPMPPNPASGTMVIVRESQTRDPGWTVEEAIRAVISGGIIGPQEIN
jgi:uncharacterized membrane protein